MQRTIHHAGRLVVALSLVAVAIGSLPIAAASPSASPVVAASPSPAVSPVSAGSPSACPSPAPLVGLPVAISLRLGDPAPQR